MTVSEIRQQLDKRQIPYKKQYRKEELLQLLQKGDKTWWQGKVSSSKLKQVIGFKAYSQQDVTTRQVLNDFSSFKHYQQGKRGEHGLFGFQLIGTHGKYYLDKYPL